MVTCGHSEETIEIINLPPEVEIVKPTAGQVLTGEAMIEWEAVDPDDDADELKITLEYKPASGGDWQAIASEVPNTGKYIWDTSKLERGGKYRIRITAVDPEGASGEAISEEFTVIALTRTGHGSSEPTSDLVTFYYDIDTDGELFVYDVAGRLVHTASCRPLRTPMNGTSRQAAGRSQADSTSMSSLQMMQRGPKSDGLL
jgi:hypothetical protein